MSSQWITFRTDEADLRIIATLLQDAEIDSAQYDNHGTLYKCTAFYTDTAGHEHEFGFVRMDEFSLNSDDPLLYMEVEKVKRLTYQHVYLPVGQCGSPFVKVKSFAKQVLSVELLLRLQGPESPYEIHQALGRDRKIATSGYADHFYERHRILGRLRPRRLIVVDIDKYSDTVRLTYESEGCNETLMAKAIEDLSRHTELSIFPIRLRGNETLPIPSRALSPETATLPRLVE